MRKSSATCFRLTWHGCQLTWCWTLLYSVRCVMVIAAYLLMWIKKKNCSTFRSGMSLWPRVSSSLLGPIDYSSFRADAIALKPNSAVRIFPLCDMPRPRRYQIAQCYFGSRGIESCTWRGVLFEGSFEWFQSYRGKPRIWNAKTLHRDLIIPP